MYIAQVGDEAEWLQTHRVEFEKLAEGGDEDFVELVKELELQEDHAGSGR